MIDVPGADMPVTIPVPEPTEMTAGLLLDQVPPGVASPNVVVCPTQIYGWPVIAAGRQFTVTVTFVVQPVGSV